MKVGDACVMFAPVLESEGWLSIDLQQADILRALGANQPDLPVVVLKPDRGFSRLPFGRRLCREVFYPLLIVRTGRTLSRRGFRPLLHVADHSYGHLCRWWNPCVVNCNDLTHFVRPEISGLSLRWWRGRVRAMRHADKILAISGPLAGEVRRLLPVMPERVTGLVGGVDTDCFKMVEREEARRLIPGIAALHEGERLVINIGSNVRRKNLPTVLRAIAILRSRGRPVRLLKVGEPLHGGEHAPLLRELGIDGAVADVGTVDPKGVAAICNLGHALAFASLYEGFGRPVPEAQACGLPCVLADTPCAREIGGDAALYHEPLDPAELALRMEDALFDENVRAGLIRRGLGNVRRFCWTGYTARLREIYDEVLTNPEPESSPAGERIGLRTRSSATWS